MERAFSALNSDPPSSFDKMLRAKGPFYTSLVADPAKREGEALGTTGSNNDIKGCKPAPYNPANSALRLFA